MKNGSILTIASGKGGTGKTTIAVNLAEYISKKGISVQYLDCDVEEPNGHIFLKPNIEQSDPVTVNVPEVKLDKCIGCGKCGEICQYSAIICIKENVLTFEQLCHSCSGCWRICPANAIDIKMVSIGKIEKGCTNNVDFIHGILDIGFVRTPYLIKQVKTNISPEKINIIDAPPGTSCAVVETLKDSNFVLLVTEPTPFGLNDLKLAVDLVRKMKLPFGVIINRYDCGDNSVEKYCENENIDIAMKLSDSREIAKAYSIGGLIFDLNNECSQAFSNLHNYLISKKIKVNQN